MRLHRLTLTAFGPFSGTHTVDFDALCSAGLFLLHGPTGAGKTSVLDAVCFALYGGVPGARQQPGGTLRSDHADPRTRTEVVLELTVAGRRLELTRAPEQLRPKARGTGLTRERARCELRAWDPATGQWHGLSRSHQETGEEIKQALGMSKDQFCQVVLLPQGDFARFLRSGAEDRAKLLGRLFDTGRFAAVEEELARMRKGAQQEVATADEELLGLAHRMRQAVGDPPELAGGPTDASEADPFPDPLPSQRTAPAAGARAGGRGARRGGSRAQQPKAPGRAGLAPGDPGLADTVLIWAAQARSYARERLTCAALAAETAHERHGAAAGELEAARELAREQQRFARARQRADELAARAGEREALRRQLERAQSAEAVAPALHLRRAAHDGHSRAQEAEREARARLPGTLAGAAPEQLAEFERELRQELGALCAAREEEPRAAGIETELRRLDAESRADEEVLREAGEWLAGWEERRPALERRIEEARDAALRAEHLGGRLHPARARLQAARRRDQLAGEIEAAVENLRGARDEAAEAKERWLAVREQRLRGVAAELAANLTEGEPCAVCGSTSHPDPAREEPGHVDRAAEEAALTVSQQAVERRQSAEQRLAALRENHAAAEEEAAGGRTEAVTEGEADSEGAAVGEGAEAEGPPSTEALADAVASLEREHAQARAQASGIREAEEELAVAEREYTERQAARQEAERRLAAGTSTRDALQRELAALTERLTRARGEAPSVAARFAELERRVGLLSQAAEAGHAAARAADRLTEAAEQLAEAADRAGFSTPEEAERAVLPESEQHRLRSLLEQLRAEEAAVREELADPVLAAAAARPPADPERAQAAAEAAEGRLRAADAEHHAARARVEALDGLGARATDRARRLAPLRTAYDRIARLAGLAAGTSAENERRMRLESYVLAARLEQVAAAASTRLARMSGGRYTLVHSDERASGRGRSGLGLHVVDAWTGAERDTATLSGGETFFASLALALGLADVVTEEAGGTRLETLFIDEGFGTLDEQTLDEVLDVLDSLRERDRCVGIVSHVTDLRQRVPAQLEVVKSRSGSTLRHHTTPADV
ncbi:AAA family ATPase [Streptomyces spirodelae]|uniref:Nuclease SbcCD subunit C n=1 Tax=Streptomyces spirodelae TaxID=2812904 RepID=A0ABS3X0I8_9ACTN|nr:SMC family ATPase [Streptomyces spirodelae]MBO8188586.1 SMC family ATPase [Streptomyces spirodelae]